MQNVSSPSALNNISYTLLDLPYSPDGAPSQYHYILYAKQYLYILHDTWPTVDQWALRKHYSHAMIGFLKLYNYYVFN